MAHPEKAQWKKLGVRAAKPKERQTKMSKDKYFFGRADHTVQGLDP